jgi:predicted transcriptional regulator
MIRQETGAAITIVHHTGKSGSGYRGSSVLYGSVESWIDVSNDDGLITVACGKSKDAKPFPPRYLRMMEVGDSVVLLPADQVSQRGSSLTEGQRKTLETLALDIFTGPGAKRSELVGATGMPEPTMYKILSRLKRLGFINQGKRGDPYFISDEGMSAIRSYHRDLKHQREKISNYPETINELSDSSSTNYQTISLPLKGEIVIVDSSEDRRGPRAIDMGSDLFPEDEATPPKPPITDMVARLKNSGARVLGGSDLRQALADGTDTTISSFTEFSEESDDAAGMA